MPSFSVHARPIHARRAILTGGLALALAMAFPSRADAQIGTGGTTGTGTTGLTQSDFYTTVQKVEGVNLVERDVALFLNQASCLCKKDVWLKSILVPQSFARSALIPATAEVAMYLGSSCSSSTERAFCYKLGASSMFSDFRANGITRKTSVDVLAKVYARNATTTTGTGGAGGSSGTGTGTDADCTSTFGQTLWILVFTQGSGADPDYAITTKLTIDSNPPPTPSGVPLTAANEALNVTWKPVETTTGASDLLGYQLLCTRADTLQVFNKPGSKPDYTAAFDSCPTAASVAATNPITRRDPMFVCSDLLPVAATSQRLKILQNGIVYGVGVTAIDNQRNASVPQIFYEAPIATEDFYFKYRHGDPAGTDAGGYCAVAPATTHRLSKVAVGVVAAGLLSTIFLGLRRRRRHGNRRDDAETVQGDHDGR